MMTTQISAKGANTSVVLPILARIYLANLLYVEYAEKTSHGEHSLVL